MVKGEPAFDCGKQATPDTILPMIEQANAPGLFLLRDFHLVWEAKKTALRKLRNLAQRLPRSPVPRTLVISTPPDLLPVELRHPPGLKQDIVTLELGKPDAGELQRIVGRVLGDKMPRGEQGNKLAGTALGLSGVQAARVLGTCLTWMQEKRKPVCVIATANAVERLPPEFLRKGRFDEMFFLDLPTREERTAIFKVHLEKRGYTMVSQRFALERAVAVTEGFVGAELEAVVKDAMFPAFMDGERELSIEDLVKSAGAMVPLARSRAEHIQKLRRLVLNGEARNASRAAPAEEVQYDQIRGERIIDLK